LLHSSFNILKKRTCNASVLQQTGDFIRPFFLPIRI
jgi:hypothetical protein